MNSKDSDKEAESDESDAPARKEPKVDDEKIDEALEETFPASDPPAY
jgi:hypothetical protein